MKDFKNIEIIEAYLEGELVENDREQFEQTMNQDEELTRLVEKAKTSIKVIQLTGHFELKKKLQEIHHDMVHASKKVVLPTFLRYAAIFIAIISIAIVTWYTLADQKNYSNLYADNFEPYTNLLTVKGENNNATLQSLVNTAMYQYDLKNYENANKSFKELLIYKQNNDTILFYFGISCLGAGETQQAIDLFGQLLEQKESLFYRFGHAKWYLALAYLKDAGELQILDLPEKSVKIDHRLTQSKILLEEIISEQGDYSDKAKKILQQFK